MSFVVMNEVVGKAVISESFRAGLFNGRRAEMLSQFAGRLDADEYAALLNIEADGPAAFAAAIEQWIKQRAVEQLDRPKPPALLAVARWPSIAFEGACLPSS